MESQKKCKCHLQWNGSTSQQGGTGFDAHEDDCFFLDYPSTSRQGGTDFNAHDDDCFFLDYPSTSRHGGSGFDANVYGGSGFNANVVDQHFFVYTSSWQGGSGFDAPLDDFSFDYPSSWQGVLVSIPMRMIVSSSIILVPLPMRMIVFSSIILVPPGMVVLWHNKKCCVNSSISDILMSFMKRKPHDQKSDSSIQNSCRT
jgi:hypothetical protein